MGQASGAASWLRFTTPAAARLRAPDLPGCGAVRDLRPQLRLLLSKREAALALGMSIRHFERHVQGQLRCVRCGQLTLYRLGDLERWAEEEATLGGRSD